MGTKFTRLTATADSSPCMNPSPKAGSATLPSHPFPKVVSRVRKVRIDRHAVHDASPWAERSGGGARDAHACSSLACCFCCCAEIISLRILPARRTQGGGERSTRWTNEVASAGSGLEELFTSRCRWLVETRPNDEESERQKSSMDPWMFTFFDQTCSHYFLISSSIFTATIWDFPIASTAR